MPTWLSNPLAPAWAQAVFAALAIIGAVWVSTWQRSRSLRDARDVQAREDKERLRRLTAGLRAEIEAALEAAARQQSTIEQTLQQVSSAVEAGAAVVKRPIRPGSMALTEAIVYRQAAAEIGRFPPGVVRPIVQFYSSILEVGRLADAAPNALKACEILKDLAPRLRMSAAMLIKTLEKFEASGFTAETSPRLAPAEVRELAKEVGYPLDDVLRERGINAQTNLKMPEK